MVQEKNKVGRPAVMDAEKRKLRQIRMTDTEYERIVRKAKRSGKSFSDYMRGQGLK